jgi:hypothetical protein
VIVVQKWGVEIFKPVIGNWRLQETSNENGIRAIDFANNNNNNNNNNNKYILPKQKNT